MPVVVLVIWNFNRLHKQGISTKSKPVDKAVAMIQDYTYLYSQGKNGMQ
jgi:hypothetical protein